jgi:hypothetical protein
LFVSIRTKNPPANLKTDVLIRPVADGEVPLIVDVNEYMTIGGGRFMKVENFPFVRNFLASSDTVYQTKLQPGTYTADELLLACNKATKDQVAKGTAGRLSIKQYYLGVTDIDYQDRAYIFGSESYKINPEARFIVNADGSREIRDIAVVPVDDNFDFKSDSIPAQITNFLTKDRLDPSGIGRTVVIKYTGSITEKQNLTQKDSFRLEALNLASQVYKVFEAGISPSGIIDFAI